MVLPATLLAATLVGSALAEESVAPAPNGITLPLDYKDWRVISVLQRTDNDTLRAIVGNDAAIAAVRSGNTKPWPDGAMIGKLVWRAKARPNWGDARVPDRFQEVEFMRKDRAKYPTTGGWGFAKWSGKRLTPFGDDANFALECFGCHTLVKDNDFIFVEPAPLP